MTLYIIQNGERHYFCMLNESVGIYQMTIDLKVFAGIPLIIEVVGKGTVHMIGRCGSDGLDLLQLD